MSCGESCTCAETVDWVLSRLLPPSLPSSASLRGSRLSVMPRAPFSQVQSTQPFANAASNASQGGGPLAVVGGPLPARQVHKRCGSVSIPHRNPLSKPEEHVGCQTSIGEHFPQHDVGALSRQT